MIVETLDSEIKARVTVNEREAVNRLAKRRRLSSAYIVREALSEYFRTHKIAVAKPNGKEAAHAS